MPYVQRDGGGVITGVFANLQSGYAEEFLQANDAEVVAFLAPKPDSARIAALKTDAGLIDLWQRAQTATPAQIDAWLAANVTTLPQARAVLASVIKVLALKMGGGA